MEHLVRESKTRHRSEKLLDKSLFRKSLAKSDIVSGYEKQVATLKKTNEEAQKGSKPKVKTDLGSLMRKILVKAKPKLNKAPYALLKTISKILASQRTNLSNQHLLWTQFFLVKNLIPLSNGFFQFSEQRLEQLRVYIRREVQLEPKDSLLHEIPLLSPNPGNLPLRQTLDTLIEIQQILYQRSKQLKKTKKVFRRKLKLVLAHLKFNRDFYQSSSFELNSIIEHFLKSISMIADFLDSKLAQKEGQSQLDLVEKFRLKSSDGTKVILSCEFFHLNLLVSSLSHLMRNYPTRSKQSYIQKLFKPLTELNSKVEKLRATRGEYQLFREVITEFFFQVNTQKLQKGLLLVKRQQIDRSLDLNSKDFRNNEVVQAEDSGEQAQSSKNQNKVSAQVNSKRVIYDNRNWTVLDSDGTNRWAKRQSGQ